MMKQNRRFKTLFMLIVMLFTSIVMQAQNAEPYAALSENNTVLTFYYDNQKEQRNGMGVGPFSQPSDRGWANVASSITKVVFDDAFEDYKQLTSIAGWFEGCTDLTEIVGLDKLRTLNVTNMSSMFYGCFGLTSLDVSHFNTENVTDMSYMFRSCSALTNLDVSGFKTDNVTNMFLMFDGCSSLTDLDVSNFNTSNVTDMGQMFQACYKLTSLDLSNFNTANVTNMGGMFNADALLTTLDLSTFNTSKVTEMSGMFRECPALTTIYVGEGWSTANVTSGYEMFTGSTNLVGGKGTHYDPNHIDYTYARIDGGPNSQTPGYFTDKNVPVVTDPEPYAVLSDNNTVLTFYYDEHKEERNGMSVSDHGWSEQRKSITNVVFDASFANCTTLISTSSWFIECSNLVTITGINNLNTSNVVDMSNMFFGCSSLMSLDVSGFNTANVTNMRWMFVDCTTLKDLDVSNFNTANVIDMDRMFQGCSGLTSLDLSNFNTSIVMNMYAMFSGCSGLKTVYVGDGWTTSAVMEGNGIDMFSECINLVGGKGTHYDPDHTDYTYARIDGGPDSETPGYFTRSGDEPWVDPATHEVVLTGKDANYWRGADGYGQGEESVVLNSPLPPADISVWENSLLDMFVGNQLTFTTPSGGPVNNVTGRFYFEPGDKFETNDFGTRLMLDREPVAEMNPETGQIRIVNSETTRRLLEETYISGPLPIRVKAYGPNDEELMVTNGLFNAYLQRPVSATSAMNVTMSLPAGATAKIVLDDVLTLEDWRGEKFDRNASPNLYEYYRVQPYTISENGGETDPYRLIQTDLGGQWTFLYLVAPDVSVTYDQNENNGTITFVNNGASLGNFRISIPVTVSYEWGEESPTVSVNVTSEAEPIDAQYDAYTLIVGSDVTMPQALEAVGGRGYVTESVAAIVWNSSATLTESDLQGFNNPNMLIFVMDGSKVTASGYNVVVNGAIRELVLKDVEGNGNFIAPMDFKVQKISYTREFRQQTQIGISRGWESLALPFAVQTITHQDKGTIAPFGSDASGLHFWLRRLGREGLTSVQRIEANTPYVISMPNSEDYASRFNLNGRVTFAAEDVTVPATATMVDNIVETDELALIPAFQRMAVSEDFYALNVGEERNGRPEGSIFERNYRQVRPFEAYTVHRGDRPAPLFFDLSDLEGSTTDVPDVRWMMDDGNGEWYDLQGRKLGSTLNVQRSTLKKGVYIHNGRKTVVK